VGWFGRVFVTLVIVGLLGVAGAVIYRDSALRADLLKRGSQRFGTRVERVLFFPSFDANDERGPKLKIVLKAVARGLKQPTDMVFLPEPFTSLVVLEQAGRVTLIDPKTGVSARWLDLEVVHDAPEQGLLGLAMHPAFERNGRLFLSYTALEAGETHSFVSEYRVPDPTKSLEETPFLVQHVMRLKQPQANHNGGCIRFGPDGMLYVGWGDGGGHGDPEGEGQNGTHWLGSILRVDVSSDAEGDAGAAAKAPYRIPTDNPFRDRKDVAPETFVIGVRNPWRFSWDSRGRMIVADVGQDEWEEVGFALPGENLGWNAMEGRACFGVPDCDEKAFRQPFLVYPHKLGRSVTGGLVSEAEEPEELLGLYVYADYESGRLWAVKLPDDDKAQASAPISLGAWPLRPSTFTRDRKGRLYVADHGRGVVFRLDPKWH